MKRAAQLPLRPIKQSNHKAGYAAFAARSCKASAASSTKIAQVQPATNSPQNVVASTNKTSAESNTAQRQRAGRVAAPPSCSHEGTLAEQLRRRTAEDISAGATPRAQEPSLCYTDTLCPHSSRVWASWLGYPIVRDGLRSRNKYPVVGRTDRSVIGEIHRLCVHIGHGRLCSNPSS